MPRSDRPYLGAVLTRDAYDGWYQFARDQGVTTSSLIEAIGRMLAGMNAASPPNVPPLMRAAVKDARAIAHERRGRRPSD